MIHTPPLIKSQPVRGPLIPENEAERHALDRELAFVIGQSKTKRSYWPTAICIVIVLIAIALMGCTPAIAGDPAPAGRVAGPVGVATPRDPATVYAFRKANACPSTGKLGMGACPGWVVDHVLPLCLGGPDVVQNMQWQEVRQSYIKDVFERQMCATKKKLEATK